MNISRTLDFTFTLYYTINKNSVVFTTKSFLFKKIENTNEKTTSKVTKETSGTVAKNIETTPTVPTQNEEPAPQPQQVVEPEPPKPVEEPKVETKKIDLSKYDYYEESINGSYKGFIYKRIDKG